MKKILYIAIALPLLAGCAQTIENDVPTPALPDGMKMNARISAGTRSHFVDDTSPVLAWDATDKVLVYSCYLGSIDNPDIPAEGLDGYITGEVAPIVISDSNPSEAVIYTSKTAADWMPRTNPTDDDAYIFLAYYPASSVAAMTLDSEGLPYINHTIPTVQDGVHYGDYQFSANIIDMENPPILPRSAIMQGTDINFDAFQPLNALLRLKLSAIAGSYQVSSLVIRFEETDWKLAGPATHTVVLPFMVPQSDASPSVTLQFENPITVSADAQTDWIYAAVLSQKELRCRTKLNVVFEAYDAENNLVLRARKETAEGGFAAGQRYNSTIAMAPIVPSVFSVSEPGTIPFEGKLWEALVTSYVADDVTGEINPAGYTVQLFKDEDCTEEITIENRTEDGTLRITAPGIFSLNVPADQGIGQGNEMQETLPIQMHGNSSVGDMEIIDMVGNIRATLRTAPPVGSATAPYNLSNATGAGSIQNTANCYIIGAPGYYKLPLVLGNAIKNSVVNTSAFTYTGEGRTPVKALNVFKDYLDGDITSPYIHNSSDAVVASGHVPTSACIMWEDVQGLIEAGDDFILPAPQADANGVYWLSFHIPADIIDQGNALIAVRDEDGTIMWSWHIWVTDYTPSRDVEVESAAMLDLNLFNDSSPLGDDVDPDPSEIEELVTEAFTRNTLPFTYKMMRRNLGYVVSGSGSTTTFAPQTFYALFTQEGTGATVKVTLQIEGKVVDGVIEDGNNPYFQWGRKDPILAASASLASGGFSDKQVWGLSNTSGLEVVERKTEGSSAGYTIQHPHMHIDMDHDGYNVYGIHAGSNLWNTASNGAGESGIYTKTNKSIYDPSPTGYMVAPIAAYWPFFYCVYSPYAYTSLNNIGLDFLGIMDISNDSAAAYVRAYQNFYGNRLAFSNDYGTVFYADKAHSNMFYMPACNLRTNHGGALLTESDVLSELDGRVSSVILYPTSDQLELLGTTSGVLALDLAYPLETFLMPFLSEKVAVPLRIIRDDLSIPTMQSGANSGSYIDDFSWN